MKEHLLVLLAGALAVFACGAGDAFYGCDALHDFSAANQKLAAETCVFTVGAGREAGKNAFRLRTPATEQEALLFFPAPQTSVEDVAAPVTVSGWFRGSAEFTFGIGSYDVNHRNVYPSCPSTSDMLTVRPVDGWKKFSYTFVPPPGDPYAVSARFLMPTVRIRPGGELLADDLSLVFAKPPKPAVGAGTLRAVERAERVTELSFADTTVTVESVRESVLFTFRLADRDVAGAIAMAQARPDAPAWSNDGVELMLGNKVAHLHFAFDFRGRLYSSVRVPLWTESAWTKDAFVFRLSVPRAVIPADPDCDLRAFVSMYRKCRGKVTPFAPGCKGFQDMSAARLVPLAGERQIAANLAARAKEAEELKERIAKIGAACGMLPQTRLAEEETLATIPDAWRPAKVGGRDYRVLLSWAIFKDFRKLGIGNEEPMVEDAILWAPWEYRAPEVYEEGGELYEFLEKEPQRLFAVKTLDCYAPLTDKQKNSPALKAMFDKRFMDFFFDRYGERFLGFFEDEAFINSTGKFREILNAWKLPLPKNRDEAYGVFKTLYSGLVGTNVPYRASFRNLANNCAYARGKVASVAASSFNPYVSALGDVMSGNETGDCMGPTAVMYSFARGAARQWGRPWRNYQTYYGWRYLQDKTWGGRACGPRTICMNADHILSPKCRYTQYGFLNGPVHGTDRERQKAKLFEPFMSGASVWSSEAHHEEMFAWYDEDETVDPSVLPLRDPKFRMSYMCEMQRRFWNTVVRRRDRGVGVTPVAFVWDRANGYASNYFGPLVWDFFTPNEMEKTMWALLESVYKPAPCGRSYTRSAYGDVFDQVTNDATAEFLKNYRVLYLVGDCRLDATTVRNLSEAVRAGSTLVVNAELLAKYPQAFPSDFLGVEVTDRMGRSAATYSRLDGRVVREEAPYDYRVVTPCAGTETVAFTTDETTAPAVTLKRVGKGRVLVTTPAHLKAKGSMDSMLKLFGYLMTKIREETLAIRVKTTMQYAVSRNATSWLVYFNNNDGVPLTAGIFEKLPYTDVTKAARGQVAVPSRLGKVRKVIDWWTGDEVPFAEKKSGGETWSVASTTLPGGDCAVLEFVMGN